MMGPHMGNPISSIPGNFNINGSFPSPIHRNPKENNRDDGSADRALPHDRVGLIRFNPASIHRHHEAAAIAARIECDSYRFRCRRIRPAAAHRRRSLAGIPKKVDAASGSSHNSACLEDATTIRSRAIVQFVRQPGHDTEPPKSSPVIRIGRPHSPSVESAGHVTDQADRGC